MLRRHFLQAATALPLAAHGVRLYAATPGTPRLLVVFLRGAYDAASLLVPIASDDYVALRPNIAIARPGSGTGAAHALTPDWGLAPAVAETMLPLYRRGELAFVPFAGTDDTSRSHFETQDTIELGASGSGRRDYGSGFMNRLAQVLVARDAIAFTDPLPLAFRGPLRVPNVALARPARGGVDAHASALIAGMYDGTPLADSVREGFAIHDEAMREIAADAPAGLAREMMAASRQAIAPRGFEAEARRIAHLMREGHHLGFVDVGGWDTHVRQGGADGYLATRLAELGRGLAAYADELGPAWRDSTVVVLSEFGRTFRENGNRGTDHGHGSVYWVLGGGLRGGRIVGEQVRVGTATLFQQRDYPVLNDYRALLGGLFARLYGLTPAHSQQVFASVAPRDLGLV
ncbi:MAG: DUF1501 domain-containing protein [Proteobacteria bacterium]|nr:DUF1501 domain-containing protein [Pseudomonadota bacterium]